MAAVPFTRDRFTWLAYFMLAYFSYHQTALGPSMTFLRDELDLNYTVSGLHLSAFASGMVLAGFTGERLVKRWGRRRNYWAGSGLMAAGAVLFILGRHAVFTIAAALLMGITGTLIMVINQAALSDLHGARRAVALTESNIGASVGAGLATLMIGGMQRVGIGWRGAPLAGALLWVGLAGRFRSTAIPDTTRREPTRRVGRPAPLSRIYWTYLLVIFLGVSVEWCVIFWGAEYLETVVGLHKADAALLMSLFFGAMVIGRVGGSRMTRAFHVEPLLLGALTLVALGFVPFWLALAAPLNVAGLFLVGLGIANLFPLTMSAASGAVVPEQADIASSRITLAAGSAILVTPQVLGSLADQIGIKNAYTVGAVFLALAASAAWYAYRLSLRTENNRR